MLRATIFGKFSLSDGTAVLREEDIRAGKLVQLLAYLIAHRDRVVTGNRLGELFWAGNSRNPENALKNLIYRLRSVLRTFGPGEYICTQPGGYQWNPEIPVETDYERYGELDRKIREETDEGKKEEYCREAVARYRGEPPARLSSEIWLQPKIVDYQAAYLRAAKELCGICERKGAWEELEKLCREAAEQEPLDEDIQRWLVRSLQKQQRYDQALAQYEMVKKQFYGNLGIRVPEKLEETFQNVVAEVRSGAKGIAEIQEKAGEKEEPRGAFFCDYQIFRQIYRLEVRRVGRIGISEYLLLLTVRRTGGYWDGVLVDRSLKEGTEILEKMVRESLRTGDVAARNGPSQYVVLLSACSYEAGLLVVRRIQKNFLRKVKNRRIELGYELEELTGQWQKREEAAK